MTNKRDGLSTLVRLINALCRINALYQDKIRERLTPSELVAYNALVLACDAFQLLFPLTE